MFLDEETEENVEVSLQDGSTTFCSELPKPQFATTTCSNKNALNSECEFKCEPGFTLSGVSVISCRPTTNESQWSDAPPICIPAPGKLLKDIKCFGKC